MRRVLVLSGVVLAAALLAWWALRDLGGLGDATRGVGAGAADEDAESAAVDEAGKPKKLRGRAGAQDGSALDESGVPAWMQPFREVGQDVPQDPALGAITGQIWASPGVPADEAVIEAALRGRLLARVRVRGQSRFLLKNVAPGNAISLTARSEGAAPGGLDTIVVRAGTTTDVGSVYLGLAVDPDVDNRIDVTITGDGKPLAGAQVTATTVFYGSLVSLGMMEKQVGGTVVRATTDAEGKASFERLPPAAYDVFVEAEGWTFAAEARKILQKRTKTEVRFDLKPALTIEGRAQTEDGKPVADARVILLRMGSFESKPPATTDAEGKFVAGGLTQGSYLVVVAKTDLGAKDAQMVPAGTKDLVVTIPPGAEVWMRCTDAKTGAPVTSYGVRLFRKVPFAYMLAPILEVKAADGVFRTKLLAASDYGAEVTSPGYMLGNVATLPLGPSEPFEVKLEPAGAIRGRVVAKGSGAPIRGAQVFLKRGGLPPMRMKDQQSVTDAQGIFLLDHLPRTPISFWISHVDHDETNFEGVEPSAWTPGAPLPEPRTFELGSGGTIEGRVAADSGAPEPGQTLTLMVGFDFMNARSATTDADGRYRFEHVPVGPKYMVSVGQFNPGRRSRNRSDVVVAEGEVTIVDFVPEGGGQRVAGRVTRDQKPAEGVNVSLISDDGGQFTGSDRTKADGTFAVANVPAGRYVVRATGGGSRTASLVVPADAPPAEVVLALATAAISGKVVDASTGQPLGGTWVECEQVGEAGGAQLTDIVRRDRGRNAVGADGAFSFRGLEDGVYLVRAIRDGYGTEILDGIAIQDGASKDGLSVALGPACTVSGVVRNGLGAPVDGAELQIRDAKGRRVFSISLTQSNGDGSYSQGTLRPDTFDLTFEKEGYAPATKRVSLTKGEPAKVDFTLFEGGRIEVAVKAADGSALRDAVVSLLDAAGRPVTRGITLLNVLSLNRSRTDANGMVTLTGVAPGTYQVAALATGRETPAVKSGVEVTEGALTAIEIVVPAEAAK